MMNFEDYQREYNCTHLAHTEQSQVFLVEDGSIKKICKRFNNAVEKEFEENAYNFVKNNKLLKTPSITCIGADFLEMEFIEKLKEPRTEEVINNIARLYLSTINSSKKLTFPSRNLSKDKLASRISYLYLEFEDKGIKEDGLLSKAKEFVERRYDPPPHLCLVHGDLKSPHIIPSKKEIYYIDLGLMSIASPWYDLAFLFMEKSDKEGFLEKLTSISYEAFGKDLGSRKMEIKDFLISGIFYRCLYNLGFALRHRPIKTINRTMGELKEIIMKK